jgi:hypothetical protein
MDLESYKVRGRAPLLLPRLTGSPLLVAVVNPTKRSITLGGSTQFAAMAVGNAAVRRFALIHCGDRPPFPVGLLSSAQP